MVLRSEAALQVLLQGRGEKSYSLHLWNMFQRPALWVFMRLSPLVSGTWVPRLREKSTSEMTGSGLAKFQLQINEICRMCNASFPESNSGCQMLSTMPDTKDLEKHPRKPQPCQRRRFNLLWMTFWGGQTCLSYDCRVSLESNWQPVALVCFAKKLI